MANPQLMTGLGAALSIFLSSAGSCAASVPAGLLALKSSGIRSFFPIIISGVLAIYGTIISVILAHRLTQENMTSQEGYQHFSAGLAVGLASLASGCAMGRFLQTYRMESMYPTPNPIPPPPSEDEIDSSRVALLSRKHDEEIAPPPITYSFLMVLVFIEAIALYGLIVALVLAN